ncbi:MAG: hypothetical protein K9I74_14595 [Bacteroidales bacterium]|nr:hypothetical protein [Bacteroidales bacterium]
MVDTMKTKSTVLNHLERRFNHVKPMAKGFRFHVDTLKSDDLIHLSGFPMNYTSVEIKRSGTGLAVNVTIG